VRRAANGALVFTRPDGTLIEPAPQMIADDARDLPEFNVAEGIDVAPDAAVSLWDGHDMDYDLAVHALLQDDDLLGWPARRLGD